MSQDNPQISTTPPLPGLQLVQDLNKALQTLGTDFAGPDDPAAMAWAYSTWADTGTGTLKRRNSANSAWAIEGRLLRAHLPMYAQVDVPALDIGPIYIIGKGPAEWVGAAYKPLISGIPGATFAEVDALTADEGPIICTDQDGILYAWDAGTSKYVAQTADDATALAKSSATNLITPAGLGFSLQPTLTGSATFVKATNQIQMTDIVPTLALEAGDVIQISGSVSNDNLYTVESIADADNLIVNYEHRNGAGSLSLTDETVTVSVKRIAKWFNAPLGLGQAWVDVLSSRAKNTSYTSPANRTMAMSVSGYAPTSQSWKIIVSGKTAAQGTSAPSSRMGQQLQANIPGNSVYELSNSDLLAVWAELR